MKLSDSIARTGCSAVLFATLVAIFISLVFAVGAQEAQGQAAKPTGDPPAKRTKGFESGLFFEKNRGGFLFLSGNGYKIAAFTEFFDAAGNRTSSSTLKKGQMVNIEYLWGGQPDQKNEEYSFDPGLKVLTTVRVTQKK
jgi:hypothetical protein